MLREPTKRLFELCNSLRKHYVDLEVGHETLRETGMNVSVTLGHSERNLKTFVEIGVQINKVIDRLRPIIRHTETCVNQSMTNILQCFVIYSHFEKYQRAERLMPAGESQVLVQQVMNHWLQAISEKLNGVLPHINRMHAMVKTHRQHTNLLFTLANMLKVEAAEFDNEESINVFALAESIERILAEKSEKVETFLSELYEFKITARTMLQVIVTLEGYTYEKAAAV